MQTTQYLALPYPDESDGNDVPRDLRNLAAVIEQALVGTGPLEQRPAAGRQGRYYLATTARAPHDSTIVVAWNVLYRDTGSAWVQVNASVWVSMTPVAMARSGPIAHITMDASSYCRYRLTGTTCQFKFRALVHTTAPVGYDYGIVCPVAPKFDGEAGAGAIQNIAAVASTVSASQAGNTNGCIDLAKIALNLAAFNGSTTYPIGDFGGSDTVNPSGPATSGALHLGTTDTYDRFNIEYEI